MPIARGTRFGSYEIGDVLGAGGMGEVYRARDTKLHRDVAIKVLPASVAHDPDRIARFAHEAQVLASLNHPNIAYVCGLEEAGGVSALVMELVEGPTLADLRGDAGRPMPWQQVAAIGRQIAETLSAVHAKGVVHRDLKPANVKVSPSGQVKLLDFGLAKLIDPAARSGDETRLDPKTQQGLVVGTVAYMSPEQARGGDVDERSDIWSLGVVLYELLTGVPPFDGETHAHQFVAILEKAPRPIAEIAPDVPPALTRIVERMLSKSTAERYQTAGAVASDLRLLDRQPDDRPSHPGATTATDRVAAAPQRGERTGRRVWLAAAAAVAVLALGGATAAWLRQRPPAAAESATPVVRSIAVLPFEPGTTGQDDQYLGDGIAENLINALSSLSNITVVSRNSSFRFRGPDANPKTAGRQLHVDAVVTGTVRRMNGQLVVGVALVDVAADRQLWGNQYVRGSDDVLAMQSEVARAVGSRIRQTLSGQEDSRLAEWPTRNPAAYDEYMQERFHESKMDPASLAVATAHAEKAVALDPGFADGWTVLARVWMLRGTYYDQPTEAMPRALRAVQRALEIDPQQPDAHTILGMYNLMYEWKWAEARRELVLSAALRPQAAETFSCVVHLLEAAGKGPEAEHQIRRALVADPLSVALNTELGCNAYYQRRYDRAVAEYRGALQLDTNNPVAYWGLGRAYAALKDYPRALSELAHVEEMQKSSPPIILGEIGYVHGLAGDRRAAGQVLAQLDRQPRDVWVDPFLRAVIYLGMNDRDRTMAALSEAYRARSPFMPALASDPRWDGWQAEPRFQALLAKLDLKPHAVGAPGGTP